MYRAESDKDPALWVLRVFGGRQAWKRATAQTPHQTALHSSQGMPTSTCPYTLQLEGWTLVPLRSLEGWEIRSFKSLTQNRTEEAQAGSELRPVQPEAHNSLLASSPHGARGVATSQDSSPDKEPPKAKMHLLPLVCLLAAVPPRVAAPGLSAHLTGAHPLSALLGASPLWGTHIRSHRQPSETGAESGVRQTLVSVLRAARPSWTARPSGTAPAEWGR